MAGDMCSPVVAVVVVAAAAAAAAADAGVEKGAGRERRRVERCVATVIVEHEAGATLVASESLSTTHLGIPALTVSAAFPDLAVPACWANCCVMAGRTGEDGAKD